VPRVFAPDREIICLRRSAYSFIAFKMPTISTFLQDVVSPASNEYFFQDCWTAVYLSKRTVGDMVFSRMSTMPRLTVEGPGLRTCLAPPTCSYGPMIPVNSIDEGFFPIFLSDVPTHHHPPHARSQTIPPFGWHTWSAGRTGRKIPVVAKFSSQRRDTHRFYPSFLAPSSGVQGVA